MSGSAGDRGLCDLNAQASKQRRWQVQRLQEALLRELKKEHDVSISAL